MENYRGGGRYHNVQQVVKQASTFDGGKADDFLQCFSKLRVRLSLNNIPIFNIVEGLHRLSKLDKDQVTAREV